MFFLCRSLVRNQAGGAHPGFWALPYGIKMSHISQLFPLFAQHRDPFQESIHRHLSIFRNEQYLEEILQTSYFLHPLLTQRGF